LADGSELDLAPATSAIVDTATGDAVVRLDYGNAKVRGGGGARRVQIDTPAGMVSGRGAEFDVDLPATAAAEWSVGETSIGPNVPALLIVAVLAGQVEVAEADGKQVVPAGESRAFSPQKKAMLSGRVVVISADGKRITLEGKAGKKGGSPNRREVRLTDSTEITFYGVLLGTDHPTVGYAALATLDPNAPDTAIAVEFGDRIPTVAGTIKSVSDDLHSLEIEIYRKGDAPLRRTITLDEQTRTTYSGVEESAARPTVGYQVQAWLVADTDRATEVRFAVKIKGVQPVPPAAETGEPLKPKSTVKQKSNATTKQPSAKLPPEKGRGRK
jgi:hypothetical protein